jgi:hypothetical protein
MFVCCLSGSCTRYGPWVKISGTCGSDRQKNRQTDGGDCLVCIHTVFRARVSGVATTPNPSDVKPLPAACRPDTSIIHVSPQRRRDSISFEAPLIFRDPAISEWPLGTCVAGAVEDPDHDFKLGEE